MEFLIASTDELKEVATEILRRLPSGGVALFLGEIGAGKTTLIQEICRQLGVQEAVTSPTFSLVNEYHSTSEETGSKQIFHIDLYRLKDAEEAFQMGLEEYLYNGDYCFVEWPEVASELLPEDALVVRLEHKDDQQRRIRIQDPA